MKQIVGSTLGDLMEDGSNPVTNFESNKSATEYAYLYKEAGLTGGVVMPADPLSKAAALEALHAYPYPGTVLLDPLGFSECFH